ncbi:NAD(P)-binding protein [Amycolatopsis thermoflava]
MVGTHTSQHVPPSSASPTVAVVGSGPSGCYVAQFLSKTWPDSEITVFESLPAPYGLIRYGVAADHQGTKGVVRQFDRLFTRGGIRFAGNVTVGRDIDFARLAASFDVVVLATGLPGDRELDVPRDPRARVVGAGALLRALNGFPRHGLPRAPLGSRVLVIGMGNVALDVLRLLSKDSADFTGSDIDDEMLAQLRPERPATLDVIARSGASQAKCDAAMLRELIALNGVDVAVSGLDEKDSGPVADLLRGSAAPARDEASRTRVTFHFGLVPESLTTRHGRTVLTAERRADGARVEFAADTVVTAIGFTHGAAHDDGCPGPDWAGDHVYRVGWLSRGAQGTIAQNRKHAQQVVSAIVGDFEAGRIQAAKPGFAGVAGLLAHRVVGFGDWQRIEAAERSQARPGRCRRKITDLDQMLALATGAR